MRVWETLEKYLGMQDAILEYISMFSRIDAMEIVVFPRYLVIFQCIPEFIPLFLF